jgi:hypothetical protein
MKIHHYFLPAKTAAGGPDGESHWLFSEPRCRQLDDKLARMEADFSAREAEALARAETHYCCDVMHELEQALAAELRDLELSLTKVGGGGCSRGS